MPHTFLITYIIFSYLIYRKNKMSKKNLSYIIRLTWFFGILLLFLFLIYSDATNSLSNVLIIKSFYFLYFTYFITFFIFIFKYKKISIRNKIIIKNNKWNIEKIINNSYLIALIITSISILIFKSRIELIEISLCVSFIIIPIYLIFENKLLWVKVK